MARILNGCAQVNPVPIEAIIAQDPHIASAIMFGRHRIDTGVLIEPAAGVDLRGWDSKKVEEFKDLIWYVLGTSLSHYYHVRNSARSRCLSSFAQAGY